VIRVTTPSGGERVISVVIDPERACVYLLSVLRSRDEEWREAMLEALGTELLAFVLACYEAGRLRIDESARFELRELSPSDYWHDAVDLVDRCEGDWAQVEADLIDRHAHAMRGAFSLEDVDLDGATQRADELVADLDLG